MAGCPENFVGGNLTAVEAGRRIGGGVSLVAAGAAAFIIIRAATARPVRMKQR